jgi:hypothetical protein
MTSEVKWSGTCTNPTCTSPDEFNFPDLKCGSVACLMCSCCGAHYNLIVPREDPSRLIFESDEVFDRLFAVIRTRRAAG